MAKQNQHGYNYDTFGCILNPRDMWYLRTLAEMDGDTLADVVRGAIRAEAARRGLVAPPMRRPLKGQQKVRL